MLLEASVQVETFLSPVVDERSYREGGLQEVPVLFPTTLTA